MRFWTFVAPLASIEDLQLSKAVRRSVGRKSDDAVTRDSARLRGLVLVVEENEGMREAIDNLLDAAGFSTVTYATAEALIAGGRVDDGLCVVSDIKLPGMSGFDLLTELHERSMPKPVILIAANGGAAVRSKAKRRGAAAYLAKPFAGSALLKAIDSVVESRRSK